MGASKYSNMQIQDEEIRSSDYENIGVTFEQKIKNSSDTSGTETINVTGTPYSVEVIAADDSDDSIGSKGNSDGSNNWCIWFDKLTSSDHNVENVAGKVSKSGNGWSVTFDQFQEGSLRANWTKINSPVSPKIFRLYIKTK